MPKIEDAPNGTDPILIDRPSLEILLAGQTPEDDVPFIPPSGSPPHRRTVATRFPITIISSSMTTTGPEYVVKRSMGGGSVSHSGLVMMPTVLYRARNVADDLDPATDPLPPGTVILDARPSTRDGKQILLFDANRGALPVGEHQYMVCQMVSDNQIGFDFNRAHPIVSG